MDHLLYLAPIELMLFDELSDELKVLWKENVRMETISAFESAEELERRAKDGGYDDSPKMQACVQKLKEGKMDDSFFDDFPEDQYGNLLYNLGASGISALMFMALHRDNLTKEDIESLATLSRARHRILQVNAVLA